MYSNGCPILLYTVSLSDPLYIFPIIPLTLFSGAVSICPPRFLLSLSISSRFLCVCVYACGLGFIYRCRHAYRCVCVSIIECPRCRQASSQSHPCRLRCVFFFLSPSRCALSSLPANSSHLSFLLCFHFLSVLSLSPSHLLLPFHIFLCASFLSSYYSLFLPPSSLISPSCTFVSFRLSLCSVG